MTKGKKIFFYLIVLTLLNTTVSFAQKEFFRSAQVFTKDQLQNPYSSVSIFDSIVLFNANDYSLHAYSKNNGSLVWSYKTNYKGSLPLFVHNSIVYAGTYNNKVTQTSQINLADGTLIRDLPFGPLNTLPFVKNNTLFGTAIYNGGSLLAYDLVKDTVIWKRFIAHGMSTQPIYMKDKIIANVEGDNWFAIGYNGALMDTSCAVKARIFVENIPCVKKFVSLTHDGREITEPLLNKLFQTDTYGQSAIITSERFTHILFENKLSILKDNLKQKQQLQLAELTGLEQDDNAKLIKADDENIWLFYSGHLLQYNHKLKKTVRLTDLKTWEPKIIVPDNENVWLVSGKDNLLYGISLMK